MLNGALSLIEEGGLKALTVDNLAERAQTSNGSIYHRFGSRDGMVAAALDQFLGEFETRMHDGIAELGGVVDDDAAVQRLVSQFLTFFEENRMRFRAFMIEGREQDVLAARGIGASYTIAARMCGWFTDRFGCSEQTARVCFQILLGLGAARAMWDDDQMTPDPPPSEVVRHDVSEAVLYVLTADRRLARGH
jgi:AcrR family transcriptional regulator